MIKKLFFIVALLVTMCRLSSFSAKCQPSEYYSLTMEKRKVKKEDWKKMPNERFDIMGSSFNLISLYSRDASYAPLFFVYDELQNKLISKALDIRKSKIINAISFKEEFVFTGYLTVSDSLTDKSILDMPIENFEYQDLWVIKNNTTTTLDRLSSHFIDKYYEIKFSTDGRYLICNPFTSRTAGYNKKDDGFIIIYDLKHLDKGKITKSIVECNQCLHTFIYGDTIISQREIPEGKGFDGSFHNIYQAPFNNINDTTLIARDVELLSISPDRKYILGAKYLYGEYTAVIVDVPSRKFQYVLGREYLNHPFYYSEVEKKFGFDFGSHIIYIDLPKIFPFNALRPYKKFTNKEDDKTFWKKYKYSNLLN
jgi:hypothetical protein